MAEAKWTKIYSARHIIDDWAVNIHDVMCLDGVPDYVRQVVALETPCMTKHKTTLAGVSGPADDQTLLACYNKTRELYETGQRVFREMKEVASVQKVLRQNAHTVSLNQVDSPPSMVYANAIMDTGAVVIGPSPWDPNMYDEIMPKKDAILHWPEHSDMMESFSSFCGRYKSDIRRVTK
jgi:hypothetical protein